MNTKFAPSERDPLEKVLQNNLSLSGIVYMKDILKAFSQIVYVLNEKRQIVFVNDVMLTNLGIEQEDFVLGGRPGEVFGCVHATKEPGGCGTSDLCRYCGAIGVVLKAQRSQKKEVQDAAIVIENGDFTKQLDLEITATPFYHENEKYMVVSMIDISGRKQKQAMERIFYHDIINLAGTLSGIYEMLSETSNDPNKNLLDVAGSVGKQILAEIESHRDMQLAEDGVLPVNKKQINMSEYLVELSDKIKYHKVASGKEIELNDCDKNFVIITDPVLLTRVLVNMIKNAMEATKRGGKIKVDISKTSGNIRFSVSNLTVMPAHVQAQIFQRSFSTKGQGRGLGTYSMKLIGERYLGGKVGFTSSEGNGTTFYIELPLHTAIFSS